MLLSEQQTLLSEQQTLPSVEQTLPSALVEPTYWWAMAEWKCPSVSAELPYPLAWVAQPY
jgi:hypothetical protein